MIGGSFMVKLTAQNDWQNAAFYFKSQVDCNEFIQGMRNRGAAINWNEPIVADNFPEMSNEQRKQMLTKKVSERVEDNIPWAFNSYCKQNPECDLVSSITSDSNGGIDCMVDIVTEPIRRELDNAVIDISLCRIWDAKQMGIEDVFGIRIDIRNGRPCDALAIYFCGDANGLHFYIDIGEKRRPGICIAEIRHVLSPIHTSKMLVYSPISEAVSHLAWDELRSYVSSKILGQLQSFISDNNVYNDSSLMLSMMQLIVNLRNGCPLFRTYIEYLIAAYVTKTYDITKNRNEILLGLVGIDGSVPIVTSNRSQMKAGFAFHILSSLMIYKDLVTEVIDIDIDY